PLSSYLVINDTAATALYTLSLHDALPIWRGIAQGTQHLDVAALNAVVPGIEGRTNGHQSEPDDGGPLAPTRWPDGFLQRQMAQRDRKSTRLNSSHVKISYAVFCLKKKKHT